MHCIFLSPYNNAENLVPSNMQTMEKNETVKSLDLSCWGKYWSDMLLKMKRMFSLNNRIDVFSNCNDYLLTSITTCPQFSFMVHGNLLLPETWGLQVLLDYFKLEVRVFDLWFLWQNILRSSSLFSKIHYMVTWYEGDLVSLKNVTSNNEVRFHWYICTGRIRFSSIEAISILHKKS